MVWRGTVVKDWGCGRAAEPGWALIGDVYSEFSAMLSSPALRTLFGRLPRRLGDAMPLMELGRLSLVKPNLSRILSISCFWSFLFPEIGGRSCDDERPGSAHVWQGQGVRYTSIGPPVLTRPALAWVALSSRWRLSSASFAFLARISSRRCCMTRSTQTHCRVYGRPDVPREVGEAGRR